MENNNRKTDAAKKKVPSSRTAPSARSAPAKRDTAGGSGASEKRGGTVSVRKTTVGKMPQNSGKTPQKSPKNTAPKKKSGISGATVLLVFLTVAVILVCGYLTYREITKEQPPEELPTQTSAPPSDNPETAFSEKESTSGSVGTAEMSGTSTEKSAEETSAAPSGSSETPTVYMNPIDTVYFRIPSDGDYENKIFGNDETHCTVTYYTPVLEMQAEESVVDSIRNEISKTLRRIFNKIEESYNPGIHGTSEHTLRYEFRYSSKNTLSVLFFYPVFGGYGETFENVTCLCVNARTGAVLDLAEDLAIDPLLSESVRNQLLALDIDTGVNLLNCSGWYIDGKGSELVLLYNPKFFDRNNDIVRITVNSGFTEKP